MTQSNTSPVPINITANKNNPMTTLLYIFSYPLPIFLGGHGSLLLLCILRQAILLLLLLSQGLVAFAM